MTRLRLTRARGALREHHSLRCFSHRTPQKRRRSTARRQSRASAFHVEGSNLHLRVGLVHAPVEHSHENHRYRSIRCSRCALCLSRLSRIDHHRHHAKPLSKAQWHRCQQRSRRCETQILRSHVGRITLINLSTVGLHMPEITGPLQSESSGRPGCDAASSQPTLEVIRLHFRLTVFRVREFLHHVFRGRLATRQAKLLDAACHVPGVWLHHPPEEPDRFLAAAWPFLPTLLSAI